MPYLTYLPRQMNVYEVWGGKGAKEKVWDQKQAGVTAASAHEGEDMSQGIWGHWGG